jgi:cbb3-type cytochrome oxidase maturation protein
MSLVHLIVLSLALGIAAWLFFMWTVKTGQYDDPEGAKYRMLEDDEGERPAGKAPDAPAAVSERGSGADAGAAKPPPAPPPPPPRA